MVAPFSEFLNDPEECHAFFWGMRESISNPTALKPAPMPEGIPNKVQDKVYDDIENEYHYYQGGFYFVKITMGIIAILVANGIISM